MKISLNWLKEFVNLEEISPEEISNILIRLGIEVEEIRKREIPHLVIGRIEEIEKHPNADKLKICTVSLNQGEKKSIICGAMNYQMFEKVAVALPGTELSTGKIKTVKIRGIASDGMLCSLEEIGFPSGEEGILILPKEAKVGDSLSSLMDDDVLFTITVTPNRPDLLSHFGIAREIAIFLGKKIRESEKWNFPKEEGSFSLETDICPFYSCATLSSISASSSSFAVKIRLSTIGITPINYVVDATNYLMQGWGYPLHAFDKKKIKGKLSVSKAQKGDSITLLNGTSYKLEEGDGILVDESNKIVALCGIMGSEETSVTEETSEILLECAYFKGEKIRKTARNLNLKTDASLRFERGMNREEVLSTLSHAISFLTKQGAKMEGRIQKSVSFSPPARTEISFAEKEVGGILGIPFPKREINKIFKRIGMKKTLKGWIPPYYRLDLKRKSDLVEEIVRFFGTENIPSQIQATPLRKTETDRFEDFLYSIKKNLAYRGLQEIQTSKLVDRNQVGETAIAIANPLVQRNAFLRENLSSEILKLAEYYQKQGEQDLRFFQIGNCFSQENGENIEKEKMAILLSGNTIENNWAMESPLLFDFFDLKGIIEQILPQNLFTYKVKKRDSLEAEIFCEGVFCGKAWQVSSKIQKQVKIRFPLFIAEMEILPLFENQKKLKRVQSYSSFPKIFCDISVEAPREMLQSQIEEVFSSSASHLLQSFSCESLFIDEKGIKIAKEKKAITYRLTYQSDEKTLTQEEANAENEKIRKRLTDSLPISLR